MIYAGLHNTYWDNFSDTLSSIQNNSEYNNTFTMWDPQLFESTSTIMIGPDWVADGNIQHAYTEYEVTKEHTLPDGQTTDSYAEVLNKFKEHKTPPEWTLSLPYVTSVDNYNTKSILQLGSSFAISVWVNLEEVEFDEDIFIPPTYTSTISEPTPNPSPTRTIGDVDQLETIIDLHEVCVITYNRETNTLYANGIELPITLTIEDPLLITLNFEISSLRTPTPTLSSPTDSPISPTLTSFPNEDYTQIANISVYVNETLATEDEVIFNPTTDLYRSPSFVGNLERFNIFSEKLSLGEIGVLYNSPIIDTTVIDDWWLGVTSGEKTIYKFTTPCEIDVTNANPVSIYMGQISFDLGDHPDQDAIGYLQKRTFEYCKIPTTHNCNRLKEVIPESETIPSQPYSAGTDSSIVLHKDRLGSWSMPRPRTVSSDQAEEAMKKRIAYQILALTAILREGNGEANSAWVDLGGYLLDATIAVVDILTLGGAGVITKLISAAKLVIPKIVRPMTTQGGKIVAAAVKTGSRGVAYMKNKIPGLSAVMDAIHTPAIIKNLANFNFMKRGKPIWRWVRGATMRQLSFNKYYKHAFMVAGTFGSFWSAMQTKYARAGSQHGWSFAATNYLKDTYIDSPNNPNGVVPIDQFHSYYRKNDFLFNKQWLDYGAAGKLEIHRTDDFNEIIMTFYFVEEMYMVGVELHEDLSDIQDVIDSDIDFRCISSVQYDLIKDDQDALMAWKHDCHLEAWMAEMSEDALADWPSAGQLAMAKKAGWREGGTSYKYIGTLQHPFWFTGERRAYISPEGFLQYTEEETPTRLPGVDYDWGKLQDKLDDL